MKKPIFWDVAPCSLIEIDRCFWRAYCLHNRGPDGFGQFLRDYTAQHPRRQASSTLRTLWFWPKCVFHVFFPFCFKTCAWPKFSCAISLLSDMMAGVCQPSHQGPRSGLFPSRFTNNKLLCTYCLSPPMCATCPAHLILFHFITLILSGNEYKLWFSPLCPFFHPPISSYTQ
jgi:hypothetical protein